MDKATVLGNLTRIRQAVIADRTQRKQEKQKGALVGSVSEHAAGCMFKNKFSN